MDVVWVSPEFDEHLGEELPDDWRRNRFVDDYLGWIKDEFASELDQLPAPPGRAKYWRIVQGVATGLGFFYTVDARRRSPGVVEIRTIVVDPIL